ncbi:DUF5709 domain-containing protein [Streptomyces sp. ACA25]|uniref:DUF5709 domain-containing protein n=1 Tax=Streptomyces sp. ACA25 TaxID=3022596 RepID=UPI0023073D2C|nr:DUF5709 domain-containing protein [Streptomyces sp. ACA25]MDB1090053.1 DUF5709 domain-containing protein [Streptomyces sp. ACA25]
MSDEARGDAVYQPMDSDGQDRPDDPDLENELGRQGMDRTLDEGYSPPEKPLAVNRHGTTAREQREGQSLDQRLAEEMPEVGETEGDGIGDQPGMAGEPVDEEAGDERSGRLVGSDEGFPGRGDDVFARDVGIDGGAASAEEAAVHVIPEDDESDLTSGPPPGRRP